MRSPFEHTAAEHAFHYEALRQHALERLPPIARHGLAVLLRQGVAVWMDAWSKVPTGCARSKTMTTHTPRPNPVPEGVSDAFLAAVREFVFIEDETPTRITVSAGVATFPSTTDIDSVDGLLRAADVAVMAPGTRTGASSVVSMQGPNDPDDVLLKKATEDAAALVRGIAEHRGRNVEAAERTVLEAKAYTETVALEEGLIDRQCFDVRCEPTEDLEDREPFGLDQMAASGLLDIVYQDGSVTSLLSREMSPDHFFSMEDLTRDGIPEFIFVEGNELDIVKQNGRRVV